MHKFHAWGLQGWLSEPGYYDFWGDILANDLKPYFQHKAVTDIGAGNGRIWQAAFAKCLQPKSLQLIDPHLSADASLRAHPNVTGYEQSIEDTALIAGEILLFKQSFQFAFQALGAALFALNRCMVILSMPQSIGWPVSPEFSALYAPTWRDIPALAAQHGKQINLHKHYAYRVRMPREAWIGMLENRFVSCLHHCDSETIMRETAWVKNNLPEMLEFDDILECVVCA